MAVTHDQRSITSFFGQNKRQKRDAKLDVKQSPSQEVYVIDQAVTPRERAKQESDLDSFQESHAVDTSSHVKEESIE